MEFNVNTLPTVGLISILLFIYFINKSSKKHNQDIKATISLVKHLNKELKGFKIEINFRSKEETNRAVQVFLKLKEIYGNQDVEESVIRDDFMKLYGKDLWVSVPNNIPLPKPPIKKSLSKELNELVALFNKTNQDIMIKILFNEHMAEKISSNYKLFKEANKKIYHTKLARDRFIRLLKSELGEEYLFNSEILKVNEKQKGPIYEAYIANLYRDLGYEVTEHGKLQGKKDQGVDLIAIKHDEVILIQCKNYKPNSIYKIGHKDIKSYRTSCRDFLSKNETLKRKNQILRFTLSSHSLSKSAYTYIKEIQKEGKKVDFEIVAL